MPESNSQRKQATKDAIIEAAFTLFTRKGFSGTTTREIAEQAGINELTLFRHFRNKVNLISQVLTHYSAAARMEQAMESFKGRTFEEGFHAFAETFLRELEARYPLIRLMIFEAASNPELKALIGPIPVQLRQTLVRHLERGVKEGHVRPDLDLELVAQSFLWIFLSYVMTRSDIGVKFCPYSSEEVARASTEIFLRGLRNDPEGAVHA